MKKDIKLSKNEIFLMISSFILFTIQSGVGTALIATIILVIFFHKLLQKKPEHKIYAQALAIIFTIVIVVSPFMSASKADKEMREEKAEIVSGKSDSHKYVTEEGSSERSIELIALKTLGVNKKINSINTDGTQLYIKYQAAENFTSSMTRRGIMIDASELMEALQTSIPSTIDTMNFDSSLELVDSYGNTSQDRVGLIVFKRNTWEKINWNNFITDNLERVADSFYIHPALNS